MYAVETYAAVRQFIFIEGKSRREAARVFGLSRDTIDKMCRFSAPPGYQRTKKPQKPKLGPLIPAIDTILFAWMPAWTADALTRYYRQFHKGTTPKQCPINYKWDPRAA